MQFTREGKLVAPATAAMTLVTELLKAGYTPDEVNTIVSVAGKVCGALSPEEDPTKNEAALCSIGNAMEALAHFDSTEEAILNIYYLADQLRAYEPCPDCEEYEAIMGVKGVFAPLDREKNTPFTLEVFHDQLQAAADLAEAHGEQSK